MVIQAAKWWIGGLGVASTHAVVQVREYSHSIPLKIEHFGEIY